LPYTPFIWHSFDTGGTLVTAAALNRMEQGIAAANAPTDGCVYVTDYATLDAALDAATAGDTFTRIRVVAGSTITLTNSNRLTIDVAYVHVDFQGALVDATALTSGVAITVTGTTNPPYQQATNGFTNLRILGPGRTVTGVTGILFTGPTSTTDLSGPSHVQPQHVNLSAFATGVSYGNHTYVIDLLNWDIYRCGTGVLLPAGLADTGERFGYTATTIFNNTIGMDFTGTPGDIMLIGCSLDYNSDAHIKIGSSRVNFHGVHCENGTKSTPDFTLTGNGSTLNMWGGEFVNTGSPTWAASIVNNANNGGGVTIEGTRLGGLTSTTGYLATGTGLTLVRNSTGYDIAETCEAVADTADLLADGGFEQAQIVDRWYVGADTATVGPGNQYAGTNVAIALSTAQHHSGSQALKLTKAGGVGSAAGVTLAIPLDRGQRPRLRFYYTKPGTQTGTVFITARYAVAPTNPVNGLPKVLQGGFLKQSTITLTSGTIGWTKWVLDDPTVRTPMWATHLVLEFNLVSMAAGDFYVDDVEASTL
jgi:hypothetical protein